MGYMRHHAIIVTSNDPDSIRQAHDNASNIFDWVSQISPPAMNGYRSFFIPPDGSKEHWDVSNQNNAKRLSFISWMDLHNNEESLIDLDWAEVQFGDDDGDNRLVRESGDR